MNKNQTEQLEKFKTLTRWMYQDAKASMFKAHANFLVAMALFNYTETLGMFLVRRQASPKVRFDEFLKYIGPEYEKIIINNPTINVYDELRCGLTHEGIPKNRFFCIYGMNEEVSDETLDKGLQNPFTSKGLSLSCGLIFNSDWHIFIGKFLIDFQHAVIRLASEIENGERNLTNFFEAAQYINLANFIT